MNKVPQELPLSYPPTYYLLISDLNTGIPDYFAPENTNAILILFQLTS